MKNQFYTTPKIEVIEVELEGAILQPSGGGDVAGSNSANSDGLTGVKEGGWIGL